MDPEFLPGSEHVAHCPVTNPTAKQWTYDAELYLVKDSTKYTSSGIVSFTLAAGVSDTVDFPITMPGSEGTYNVYLDVYVGGELIAAYQATEDVAVTAPAVEVFEYTNLVLKTPQQPDSLWAYYDVSCDISNVGEGAGTREITVWTKYRYYDPHVGQWYETDWRTKTGGGNTPEHGWGPPYTKDPTPITLTLEPGETYHYHWISYGVCGTDQYTYVQLRDDKGGQSNEVNVFTPSYG